VAPAGQFVAPKREGRNKNKDAKKLRYLIEDVVFIMSPFDKNHCTKQQGSVVKYSYYDYIIL
jgi:hypothetical protein